MPAGERTETHFIAELARGAQETFANAAQLYEEARLLRSVGALSRALFLHQISLEECAKIDMLGEWAISLLMGYQLDVRRMTRNLRDHRAKNATNAYMLPPNEEELAAQKRRDVKAAMKAFSIRQVDFHNQSNAAKNAALYVDFGDGKFVTPSEQISEEMLSKVAEENERFLGNQCKKADLIVKWAERPTETVEMFRGLTQRLQELRDELADDTEAVVERLIDEILEKARAEKRAGASKDRGA